MLSDLVPRGRFIWRLPGFFQ